MAAATSDTTASGVKDGEKALQDFLFDLIENGMPRGVLIPINSKATVPTTAIDDVGDVLRISPRFPAWTRFQDFRGTPTDLDTNGSPALVYDVVVVNEAGTVLGTLVSASTKAQAASGADRIRDLAVGFIANAACYIALKVTTAAATAAAGTYKWAALVSHGTFRPTSIGVYLGDAEA